jgi:branched-chain amino acid aminotransferase
MGNDIVIWRIDKTLEPAVEEIELQPLPASLDDATERLPGGGYTTFRTFDRFRVLRLASHYNRLEETAQLVGKSVHLDREQIGRSLRCVLSSYPARDMRVRIILDLEDRPGCVYLLVAALQTPALVDYQNGVRVVTRRLQRDNPKAKLTGFIETASVVRKDLPQGMNEALMVGLDGHVLEGLSSNFFAVHNGDIWTAEKGVLSGITRSLVLEVIEDAGIPLHLEGIHFDDISHLEEAFITSASRAVLPVTEIDGKPVGNGRPGPVTKRLMSGYQDRLERELEEIN